MTARHIAEKAVEVGHQRIDGVRSSIAISWQMGCGGMVGVNAGSTEPPRMVRLTYNPRNPVGIWRWSVRV